MRGEVRDDIVSARARVSFGDDVMASPWIYLLLGAVGSGRRAILPDLLGNGLEAGSRPLLLTFAGERAEPAEVRARIDATPGLMRAEWSLDPENRMTAAIPAEITHAFVLADGRANPVDQVEAFHGWLATSGAELARVITVVNCRLGYEHPELLRWYDACVHFSDVVLLNGRGDVPNKWISDFQARFRREHLPCLIEQVKNDEVANPALILVPQARRISMLFDSPAEWPEPDEPDDDDAGGDVPDLIGAIDPYLERLASGRRVKELPDLARFLAAE